jgi:S-adenosylmethionine synthetase
MFGYATDETVEMLPLTVLLAHKLNIELAKRRRNGSMPWLLPDSSNFPYRLKFTIETQVTMEYRKDSAGHLIPLRIHTIVISTQHTEIISIASLRNQILSELIPTVIPPHLIDDHTIYHINPAGRFVIGGPQGDAGLTGRKIIVDTYGGWASHGGGAFSGKVPSQYLFLC